MGSLRTNEIGIQSIPDIDEVKMRLQCRNISNIPLVSQLNWKLTKSIVAFLLLCAVAATRVDSQELPALLETVSIARAACLPKGIIDGIMLQPLLQSSDYQSRLIREFDMLQAHDLLRQDTYIGTLIHQLLESQKSRELARYLSDHYKYNQEIPEELSNYAVRQFRVFPPDAAVGAMSPQLAQILVESGNLFLKSNQCGPSGEPKEIAVAFLVPNEDVEIEAEFGRHDRPIKRSLRMLKQLNAKHDRTMIFPTVVEMKKAIAANPGTRFFVFRNNPLSDGESLAFESEKEMLAALRQLESEGSHTLTCNSFGLVRQKYWSLAPVYLISLRDAVDRALGDVEQYANSQALLGRISKPDVVRESAIPLLSSLEDFFFQRMRTYYAKAEHSVRRQVLLRIRELIVTIVVVSAGVVINVYLTEFEPPTDDLSSPLRPSPIRRPKSDKGSKEAYV